MGLHLSLRRQLPDLLEVAQVLISHWLPGGFQAFRASVPAQPWAFRLDARARQTCVQAEPGGFLLER